MAEQIETSIVFPFKALCSIPDPPRFFHGEIEVEYIVTMPVDFEVLDYNKLHTQISELCDPIDPNDLSIRPRSAEEILLGVVEMFRGLPVLLLDVRMSIPQQLGHLEVDLVYADQTQQQSAWS